MGCRVAGHVAWREIEGEVLVVDLRSRSLYGLNGPAGRVWRGIVDGAEPEALVGRVVASGAGSGEVGLAARAVGELIGELEALGLVAGGEGVVGELRNAGACEGCLAEPPRVAWREELRSFGQSCGLIPGQGDPCDQFPAS
jgi:hypothetical protein